MLINIRSDDRFEAQQMSGNVERRYDCIVVSAYQREHMTKKGLSWGSLQG